MRVGPDHPAHRVITVVSPPAHRCMKVRFHVPSEDRPGSHLLHGPGRIERAVALGGPSRARHTRETAGAYGEVRRGGPLRRADHADPVQPFSPSAAPGLPPSHGAPGATPGPSGRSRRGTVVPWDRGGAGWTLPEVRHGLRHLRTHVRSPGTGARAVTGRLQRLVRRDPLAAAGCARSRCARRPPPIIGREPRRQSTTTRCCVGSLRRTGA